MGLAEVKADVQLAREQLLKLPLDKFNAKQELTENVLPLFESICTAIEEEFGELAEELADQGEAIDELIDQSGDVLHPDTTAKIIGVFEVGKALAAELEQALPKLDDLAKKRIRQIIKTYRQGVQVVSNELAEITLTPEELEERAAAAANADSEPAPDGEPAQSDDATAEEQE